MPSFTPTQTALPTNAPRPSSPAQSRISDVNALVQSRVTSWKPSGPTVLVSTSHGRDMDIVAAALDGGAATSLATVHDLGGGVPAGAPFRARSDGALIAFSLSDSTVTRRVAILDLRTGLTRWLSSPAPGESDWGPVWAPDGNSVYFGRSSLDGDRGVMHVALDGSALASIPPTPTFGAGSNVSLATPEGVLIGSDEFNGSTVWAMDLATGRRLSFQQHWSNLYGWRSSRPRALIGAFTSIAAPGAGYLALWDDITDQRTIIVSTPVAGADFDPTGTKIVAAMSLPDEQLHLVVMNSDGSGARVLSGTDNARWPIWTTRGIVYAVIALGLEAGFDSNGDVRIVSPTDASSRTLFTGPAIRQLQVLSVAAR